MNPTSFQSLLDPKLRGQLSNKAGPGFSQKVMQDAVDFWHSQWLDDDLYNLPGEPNVQYVIEQSDNMDELLDNASIILYGDSGIGKTTLCASFPRPLFLMMSGGGEHEPMPLIGKGIPFIRIQTKEHLDQFMLDIIKNGMPLITPFSDPTADALFKKLRKDGKSDDEIVGALSALAGSPVDRTKIAQSYRAETLVIDQLTSMYNLFSSNILSTVARKREAPETMNQQDFGQARKRVLDFFYEINRVPKMRKVYLCLAERDKDPETSMPSDGLPALAGKLAREISQFVDFMFYFHLHKEQDKTTKAVREFRRIATQPYGIWKAKDSSGKLPPFIETTGPGFDLWSFMVKEIRK